MCYALPRVAEARAAPSATPEAKKMAGVVVAHLILKGDGMVYAVDADGNKSEVVWARLPQ